MIAAHALPLSSRPAARTDLGELPCPSIPLRPRARPSRRCSTTNRLPARPCRVGPRNRPRRRRRSGHAPGIPPGRGPIDRDARCYRHRCGRPRCSPTPRCAGSWRSWTGVGRRRICIRCLPPDWPIRWYRLARRRRQATLQRVRVQPAGSGEPASAVEVFGTYRRGRRTHALACRVESIPGPGISGKGPAWRIVALHIG